MEAKTRARYEARAKIVKAMAHPTRLFIIDTLAKGERCVCELTAMIGDDTSTVSKHLSLLKAAGLVAAEKRGLQVFYTLRTPCVTGVFDCVEAVVRNNAESQMAAL